MAAARKTTDPTEDVEFREYLAGETSMARRTTTAGAGGVEGGGAEVGEQGR
jgi:hypothetical protein